MYVKWEENILCMYVLTLFASKLLHNSPRLKFISVNFFLGQEKYAHFAIWVRGVSWARVKCSGRLVQTVSSPSELYLK